MILLSNLRSLFSHSISFSVYLILIEYLYVTTLTPPPFPLRGCSLVFGSKFPYLIPSALGLPVGCLLVLNFVHSQDNGFFEAVWFSLQESNKINYPGKGLFNTHILFRLKFSQTNLQICQCTYCTCKFPKL